ncbi:hypothetical protein J6590_011268 [Homalodisca vitripennis]|nr:hypothetical protein J6590_011268 [Homalodisca vitripennis]
MIGHHPSTSVSGDGCPLLVGRAGRTPRQAGVSGCRIASCHRSQVSWGTDPTSAGCPCLLQCYQLTSTAASVTHDAHVTDRPDNCGLDDNTSLVTHSLCEGHNNSRLACPRTPFTSHSLSTVSVLCDCRPMNH